MKVGTKLGLGLGALLFFAVVTAVAAIWSLADVSRASAAVARQDQRHHALMELQLWFQQLLMPANDYLIHGSPQERTTFARLEAQVWHQHAHCEGLARSAPMLRELARFARDLSTVSAQSRRILGLRIPEERAAGARWMEAMDALAGASIARLNALIQSEEDRVQSALEQAARAQERGVAAILVCGLLTVLVGGVGAWLLGRHLTTPLRHLARSTREVASGDLTRALPRRPGDEIGELIDAFNAMLAALRETLVTRDYLQRLIGSVADPLLVVDSEGRISSHNAAAARLVGEGEALARRPFMELFTDPDAARELLALARERGQVSDLELDGHTGGDAPVPLLLAAARLSDEASSGGDVVVVATDLSGVKEEERERAERGARATAIDLTVTLRHHASQPLMTATLLVDELRDAGLAPSRRQEILSTLQAQLDSIRALLDELSRLPTLEREPYVGEQQMIRLDPPSRSR